MEGECEGKGKGTGSLLKFLSEIDASEIASLHAMTK
jgi:hypothetical protein